MRHPTRKLDTAALARPALVLALAGAISLAAPHRRARADGGFALDRYQPNPVGEAGFVVDRPWYSAERWLAIGLTLDYAHRPLVLGVGSDGTFNGKYLAVENALSGHLGVAFSLFDRLTIHGSVPVTLGEWAPGNPASDAGVQPAGSAALGDPRLGVMVRLWRHMDDSPVSLHLGASVWIPNGANGTNVHAGDGTVRLHPRLVLGGIFEDHIRWSLAAGFYYRGNAAIGDPQKVLADGSSVGSELTLSATMAYTDLARRLHVGPEIALGTVVLNDAAGKNHAFDRGWSSVEFLIGAQYFLADAFQVGLAGGSGIDRLPGTPDLRLLLRLAYAPLRKSDRDHDGVPDSADACPDEPGISTGDASSRGCPDRDKDGVPDKVDACPDQPAGATPDPRRPGCPDNDRDGDGVADDKDACVEVPAGAHPDPARPGCPLDTDRDGTIDEQDACPKVPAGAHPDPARRGCPLDSDQDGVADEADACPQQAAGKLPDPARPGCPLDSDHDGVIDEEDLCPQQAAGLSPDPARRGCPLPDRDGDHVPDAVDACPDKPGAPDADPKKNGCPGLVQITGCAIKINEEVFFATGKDVILPRSFAVLGSVASALQLAPQIKRVAIEGHTDSAGKLESNMDLSSRRAAAVVRFLEGKGVAAGRLEAHGYGPTRPVADNKTPRGRAQNRRVEFNIVDPVCAAPARPAPASK